MNNIKKIQFLKQKGIAFGYVISLIAVTASLLSVYALLSNSNVQQKLVNESAIKLTKQIEIIKIAVNNCSLLYPSGDNGSAFNKNYPAGQDAELAKITCPGDPRSNKNIWANRNGLQIPFAPAGLGDWKYSNTADGISITVTSDGSSIHSAIFNQLSANFSSLDATVTGNVFTYWIIQSID